MSIVPHLQSGAGLQQGAKIVELGRKIGADAVLRAGSNGVQGLNRVDNANFADAMLKAIDGVSAAQNRAEELQVAAIIDPDSVDVQDIAVSQAEAAMSLNITRTILSRLTQAWKDIINTR